MKRPRIEQRSDDTMGPSQHSWALRGSVDSAPFTPSAALEIIAELIAEVPLASGTRMDQIKMLDKLLNTARAMMETRLKNEEALEIRRRLDELEARLCEVVIGDTQAPGESAEE